MDKLAVFLLLFLCFGLTAQEPMRVTRSAAVDRNSPINNIYVDAENNKWVGNSLGVFQVHTVDYASPLEKEDGQSSLLRYPGGNYQLLWNKEALFNQMREETDGLFEGDIDITSMFYDDSNKELWISTRGIGIFRFNMSGTGELIENMSMDNSKLRTDMINTMLTDRPGSYWIATEEGVLHNSGRKWKVYEQYVNIEALAVSMDGVWVFGEGYLWKVDAAGDWEEIELKESFSEGKIRDIAFDSRGRMWIASEIITRYNPEIGSVEKFGAAEYFTSDFPTALAVDQDDAIWVGTEDKGLYLIEKATAMSISCILDKAPSCDGQNDARLKVIVSGGIEPYTFQWNENLNGKNPKDVAPGKYVVTVTDSKGKSKTAEVQINDPAITVSVQQTQPESSPGAGDGAASATVTGGQGNYLYKWETGSTESTAKNLQSGEYSLTVTDEGGCSTVAKVNISQEAAPLSISIEQTQAVTCVGAATAALKVNLSGGRGPYEYNWSNQKLAGETPEDIAAGEYTLTITDREGTSANASITIEDAASFTADILIDAPATTGNADGKATVKTAGGTAPFTFVWDNGESTATATTLAPGERSITVTDANGCTTTSTISIDENILPLSVSIEQTGTIKCPGQSEAALSTQVRGGKGPFTFAWSDSKLTGDAPQNLAAGNYTLTITDSEGTSANASITVEDAASFTADILIDAPASTGNADGKATVKTAGGTAPFTFVWDNGESTATATTLAPGERSVTVTDANGCTTTSTISIDENILPLSVSIEQTGTIKCPGQSEAALSTQVRGGKGPFTFAWSDSKLIGDTPQNLTAGNYTLTITDSEGTSANASITIEEPKTLTANIIVDAPASTGNADGKATAKGEGGTAPYTFQWDNGESTATATKLAPGERLVTVTDTNGCTTTSTISIDENILPLSVSIEQTGTIKCPGQSEAALSTQVRGGKGPFTFAWSDSKLTGETPQNLTAGNYTLTITDSEGTAANASITIEEPKTLTANIIVDAPASTDNADGKATAKGEGGTAPYTFQWDNGESAATATTLEPGERTVTVTDANGCTATGTVSIDENILPLSVSIEQTEAIKCQGQNEATLATQVRGGKGPFSFAWSDSNLTGETPQNLTAGNYTLTITDSEGTAANASITVEEPKTLTANIIVDAPASTDNADGKATAKGEGGTAPFTFQWDNGESAATATKLAPGERSVTVTDANGCTATGTVSIDENILPLSVSIEQTEAIKCQGQNEATLATQVRGGKGPFSFAWSDSNLTGETPQNLTAGNYPLTITDSEGTAANASITIEEPKTLTANIIVDAPASTDNADGKATAKGEGGTAPFTFQWDNGESTATATKLAPGERSVTVTDANGCTATGTVSIDENILPLSVSIEQTEAIKCQGQNEATLATQVRGGKGPFTFAWSDSKLTGETPQNLTAGNYTLTITDSEGTAANASITIEEPKTLDANIIVDAPASTDNADGKATANAEGGTAPYAFQWDNGESTATATKLAPGERAVTVTDANGCTATGTVSIDENILPLSVSIEQTEAIKCQGQSISIKTTIQGGKGPFEFSWNNEKLSGESPNSVSAGSYELSVTDALGTVAVANININEPAALSAAIVKNGRVSNPESQDGLAKVEANGGTTPYTFKWDNGETGDITKTLAIGNHSVTATDANGCSTNLSFETKKTILPELNLAKLRTGQNIRMEELFFEADSFRITPQSIPVLDEVYDFLSENTAVAIEVGGHTNNIPETAFCDYLSEERAKSVANYIVRKGIDPQRVFYKGYGKRDPIATNRTAEGRARNQRVEIKILKF